MAGDASTLWQKQARELGGEGLVTVIEGMAQDLNNMKYRLDMMDKHILKAYPGGDLEGHRRYHELMIQRNEEIRGLKQAIKEKTLTGLVWSAMAFIGWCVWSAIKQKIAEGL